MDQAHAYTAQDWVLIIGAVFTGLTSLAAAVLGYLNSRTASQAKAISTDTNQKATAIVEQSREIARAVPGASTDPTDIVIQRGPATGQPTQRATDPQTGA